MIGLSSRARMDTRELEKKLHGAAITNLGHAGGAIRRAAQRSIKITPAGMPAPPGSPPHSRAGQLKRAIIYQVSRDRLEVVVGPTADLVGPAAAVHEYGGRRYRDFYPARPFMGPAFERIKPRLAPMWANSVR